MNDVTAAPYKHKSPVDDNVMATTVSSWNAGCTMPVNIVYFVFAIVFVVVVDKLVSSLDGVVNAEVLVVVVVVVKSAVTPPVLDEMVLEADIVVDAVVGDNKLECPNVTMDGKRTVMVGSGFNMGVVLSSVIFPL